VDGTIRNGTLYFSGDMYMERGTLAVTLGPPPLGDAATLYIGGDQTATVHLDTLSFSTSAVHLYPIVIGSATATGPAGTVQLGNSNTVKANIEVDSGTLDLNGYAQSRISQIRLLGGVSSVLVNENTTTAVSLSTPVVLSSGAEIGGAGNLTLSGALSGSGATLTKIEGGMLLLSGNNTFNNGTIVSAGAFQLGSQNAMGSTTAPLTVNGGTLDLHGYSVTIGALSGSGGTISSSTGTSTLTTSFTGSSTFDGVIAGAVGLAKPGEGTLVLTNTNTSTGNITVSAGTLDVEGSIAGVATLSGVALPEMLVSEWR
jgi:fibronectin-binding autotransporter adhesin